MRSDEAVDLHAAYEFARLAEDLLRQGPEGPTLERIVDLAVGTIGASDYCGVSLRDESGTITTPASTDSIVVRVDELQNQLAEGPSVDANWVLDLHFIDDLGIEGRWPRWSAEVAQLGIGSMLSVRLDAPSTADRASLNLYAEKPHVFDPTDLAIAGIYARHAGTALSAARTHDQMSTAMTSRQIIGVAQGILIQRFGLDLDGAFEVLRRYSQDHNIKLRTIATNLVLAGGIPSSGEQTLDNLLLGASSETAATEASVG